MNKKIKSGRYVVLTDAHHKTLVQQSSDIITQSRKIKEEAKLLYVTAEGVIKEAKLERKAASRDIIKYALGVLKANPEVGKTKRALLNSVKKANNFINNYIGSEVDIVLEEPIDPQKEYSYAVEYEHPQYRDFKKVGTKTIEEIHSAKMALIAAKAELQYNKEGFTQACAERKAAIRKRNSAIDDQTDANDEIGRQNNVMFVTNIQTFGLNVKHAISDKCKVRAKWPVIRPGYKYMKKGTN